MCDIQISLDCPEIEMWEPIKTKPNTELEVKNTTVIRNDLSVSSIIIKTNSIPIDVSVQEIQETLAEWNIPITNIHISKRRVHNKILRHATIKIDNINNCQDFYQHQAIQLWGKSYKFNNIQTKTPVSSNRSSLQTTRKKGTQTEANIQARKLNFNMEITAATTIIQMKGETN